MQTGIGWDEARLLYETRPDETMTSLAKQVGVSHQAVSKRAKKDGWNKAPKESLVVAESLDICKPTKGSELGKRSPENIAALINSLALTRSEKVACDLVGIDPSTLYRWKQEDPELARLVRHKRARNLSRCAQAVYNGAEKDPKLAMQVLARAPETRDNWGESQDKGPTIILNIVRD